MMKHLVQFFLIMFLCVANSLFAQDKKFQRFKNMTEVNTFLYNTIKYDVPMDFYYYVIYEGYLEVYIFNPNRNYHDKLHRKLTKLLRNNSYKRNFFKKCECELAFKIKREDIFVENCQISNFQKYIDLRTGLISFDVPDFQNFIVCLIFNNYLISSFEITGDFNISTNEEHGKMMKRNYRSPLD